MKKLIMVLFISIVLFGQSENQSQSIELPDFVITGKQQITLPILKKSKADPVKLLSRDFYYPKFTPEQFSLSTISQPKQRIADLFPRKESYNNHLILGAGQYILPTGHFYFSQPFEPGLFYANLWGQNRRDFIDYADYNESGINVGSEFYIERTSSFLPGAIIGVDGQFLRKEYNFYSRLGRGNNPPETRELQNIDFQITLSNFTGEIFDYNLAANGNYLNIKDAGAKEFNYSIVADTRFKLGDLAILLNGEYQNQSIDKESTSDDYYFYKAGGGFKYELDNNLYLAGGVNYYNAQIRDFSINNNIPQYRTQNLIGPWGEVGYKINSNMSLTAKYERKAEFKTFTQHLRTNPYLILGDFTDISQTNYDNSYVLYNHSINLNFTFAYKKYYEINVGVNYFTADNYYFYNPDFSFDNTPGIMNKFKLDYIEIYDVTGFSVYANALYHLGPFGWFYGDAKFQQIERASDYLVPYKPQYEVNAEYGYKFTFGLSASVKIKYLKEFYADFMNYYLLDDYINLSSELRYSLTNSFDLTLQLNNLLNRENYFWVGYEEPPFDFVAGIDLRF